MVDSARILGGYASLHIDDGSQRGLLLKAEWHLEGIVSDDPDAIEIPIDSVMSAMGEALKANLNERAVSS